MSLLFERRLRTYFLEIRKTQNALPIEVLNIKGQILGYWNSSRLYKKKNLKLKNSSWEAQINKTENEK